MIIRVEWFFDFSNLARGLRLDNVEIIKSAKKYIFDKYFCAKNIENMHSRATK